MKSLLLGWALGFSLLALPAAAQDFPKLSGRVVDQADIIPAAEEANLTVQLEQLEKTTGHQLVVATVNSLDGNDISDYGYKLGRAWGIGGKENNDGVVFLIAPNAVSYTHLDVYKRQVETGPSHIGSPPAL